MDELAALEEFAVGNKVCLHSGGPWMTIRRIGKSTYPSDPEVMVTCQWFDLSCNLCTSTFPPEMLTQEGPKVLP